MQTKQERSPAWFKADAAYRAARPRCELCGLPGGPLGCLDGVDSLQSNIEAHDVIPYHLLSVDQKNSFDFLMTNLISLHHFEHHHIAHLGDPDCRNFLPQIRSLAAAIKYQIDYPNGSPDSKTSQVV